MCLEFEKKAVITFRWLLCFVRSGYESNSNENEGGPLRQVL